MILCCTCFIELNYTNLQGERRKHHLNQGFYRGIAVTDYYHSGCCDDPITIEMYYDNTMLS